MGGCFSTIKVSGSNSNNTAPATPGSNHNRKQSTTAGKQEQRPSHGPNEPPKKQVVHKPKNKLNSRSRTGVIPCGTRTDFGYDKNFDKRYTIGKLLGHGQFGYTYVATDRANRDQVAAKRIDKNKALIFGLSVISLFPFPCFSWTLSIGLDQGALQYGPSMFSNSE